MALVQPAEYLVIIGAAIGSIIVSTPMAVLHQMIAQVTRLFKPAPGKEDYVKLLGMLYQLFRVVQQNGMMALIFAHLFSMQLMRELFAKQVEQGKGPAIPGFSPGIPVGAA